MSAARFTLMAMVAFAVAFGGISWASKGFPVISLRSAPAQPDAEAPPPASPPAMPAKPETVALSSDDGIKAIGGREMDPTKPAPRDGNRARDALRIAVLQAANGYSISPCDPTIRRNLIEAVTAYTASWAQMAGCRDGVCGGDQKRLEDATAAFRTPADMRVHDALRAAVNKGGVGRDDFPPQVRPWALKWSGEAAVEPDACFANRRADKQR